MEGQSSEVVITSELSKSGVVIKAELMEGQSSEVVITSELSKSGVVVKAELS
jgi:hypothetical protein